MPFHAVFPDEISDPFGLDCHSEEAWLKWQKQKKAVTLCTVDL
jgi:hypothetical protein